MIKKKRMRTIIVQSILAIIPYCKIDIHLKIFVDLFGGPETYSRL